MILLGRYYSPYVRRVAVTLRLLGISYEHRSLSTLHNRGEVRSVNPVGRVPALILGNGEMVIDSAAILDHIDELVGPTRALIPPKGEVRRRVLYAIALAIGATEKVASTIYEQTRRPPEMVYQPWIDDCLSQAESGLRALDQLAEGTFLVGSDLTQADVSATVAVTFIKLVSATAMPEGAYPNLERLAARCENLPAFKETRPAP